MRDRFTALRAGLLALLAFSLLPLGWPARPAQAALSSQPAEGNLPVFVFAGQSNMISLGANVNDLSPAEKSTQPQVLFYGPDEISSTWNALTPPTNTGNHFGPEISLGQQLVVSGTYGLVAEVKYAASGSNLADDWNPDRQLDFLYAAMLHRVRQSVNQLRVAYPDRNVYVAGFFWMQGEADAGNSTMAQAYAANLAHFIERVRADLGPGLPFIYGRIRLTTTYASQVRQAQADVAASVPAARLVDTDALPLAGDNLHYTSAGVVTLGKDFAASYLDFLSSLNRKYYLPAVLALH